MTCGIYILKSPSHKYYIGKSNNIEWRLHCHNRDTIKADTKLGRALRKYNFENFEIKIKKCPDYQLNEMEKYYIILYNSFKNGYNGTKGGDGGATNTGRTFSEEHCLRMSISNTGLKRTEETKKNISLSQVDRIPWNKGTKGVCIPWNKGISSPIGKVHCVHCLKIIGKNVHTRHHGDKCKERLL